MAQTAQALAPGKCGYPFQSPVYRPRNKKEVDAFEKVRTAEFKSIRTVLCLDAYLLVVAQQKCKEPERFSIALRRFLFNLADLFSNGARTGFWSNKLEFKIVDGQNVQYKRMWQSFPDYHDRSVRLLA